MNRLGSHTIYSLVSQLQYQMNALYVVKSLFIKFQENDKLHVE